MADYILFDTERAFSHSGKRLSNPYPKTPEEIYNPTSRQLINNGYDRPSQSINDRNLSARTEPFFVNQKNPRRVTTYGLTRGLNGRLLAGLPVEFPRGKTSTSINRFMSTPYSRGVNLQTFDDGTPLPGIIPHLTYTYQKEQTARDDGVNPLKGLISDMKDFLKGGIQNIQLADNRLADFLDNFSNNLQPDSNLALEIGEISDELKNEQKTGFNVDGATLAEIIAEIEDITNKHGLVKVSTSDQYLRQNFDQLYKLLVIRDEMITTKNKEFTDRLKQERITELENLRVNGNNNEIRRRIETYLKNINEVASQVSSIRTSLSRREFEERSANLERLLKFRVIDNTLADIEETLPFVEPEEQKEIQRRLSVDIDEINRVVSELEDFEYETPPPPEYPDSPPPPIRQPSRSSRPDAPFDIQPRPHEEAGDEKQALENYAALTGLTPEKFLEVNGLDPEAFTNKLSREQMPFSPTLYDIFVHFPNMIPPGDRISAVYIGSNRSAADRLSILKNIIGDQPYRGPEKLSSSAPGKYKYKYTILPPPASGAQRLDDYINDRGRVSKHIQLEISTYGEVRTPVGFSLR